MNIGIHIKHCTVNQSYSVYLGDDLIKEGMQTLEQAKEAVKVIAKLVKEFDA